MERPILARLVKGLNRVFVGMLVSSDRELLLATSISFSSSKVSQVLGGPGSGNAAAERASRAGAGGRETNTPCAVLADNLAHRCH